MQNYSHLRSYQQILAERQEKGFSEAEVKELLCQILQQLIQWHDQGQAHGLICLETIAYDTFSSQVILLQGSRFVNGYTAPEVAQSGQISAAGDIYSLGVTIAVLLTGQLPETLRNFDGSWNWMDRCVISDQFEQIISLALTEYVGHRYANARQMLAAVVPNLQASRTEFPNTPTTVGVNQVTSPPSSVSLGLFTGIGVTILCGAVGFSVSRFIFPSSNATTNNIANTPIPEIRATITITPSSTVTESLSPTRSPSISPSSANPFDNSKFPQAACGDLLPTNNDSPINFYPVFVEYSDTNLQQIKSQFCQDALPKVRKGSNRQSVQVASFNDRERAVLFAEFLSKHVKGVEVGQATIVPSSRSSSTNAIVVNRDRVSFNSGSSNAIVSGDVSSALKHQYILNCGSGQQFNASLVQGQANLRLIDPNGSTVASGYNNLGARLPISGDYTIEVSSFEPTSFNLRIEVL